MVWEHRRGKIQLCWGQDRLQKVMQGPAEGLLDTCESPAFSLCFIDNFRATPLFFGRVYSKERYLSELKPNGCCSPACWASHRRCFLGDIWKWSQLYMNQTGSELEVVPLPRLVQKGDCLDGNWQISPCTSSWFKEVCSSAHRCANARQSDASIQWPVITHLYSPSSFCLLS